MTQLEDIDQAGRRSNRRRALLGISLLAILIIAVSTLPIEEWLVFARAWIALHTLPGALLFVAAAIVLTIAMVPGSLLMAAGGFLFGLGTGFPIVWISIGVAAGSAALVSRTLLRDWLMGRFANDARFKAIDSAVAEKGFLIVVLSRLSLLMPYNLLNVIYGLSSIPLGKMTFATWLGMTPAVLLYTYIGSVAATAEQLMSQGEAGGWTRNLVIAGGLVMILVVTWVVHRTATQALRRELQQAE